MLAGSRRLWDDASGLQEASPRNEEAASISQLPRGGSCLEDAASRRQPPSPQARSNTQAEEALGRRKLAREDCLEEVASRNGLEEAASRASPPDHPARSQHAAHRMQAI